MNLTPRWLSLRRLCAGGLLALGAAIGCASPFSTSYLSGSRQQEVALAEAEVDPADAVNDPKAAALRKANGEEPSNPEEALAGVLGELQEIGAIDPAAQQQLMADLKEAKPEHYELIVTQFRAALAYRRQLARRDSEERMQLADEEGEQEAGPATRAQLVSRTARREGTVRVVEPMERDREPSTNEHVDGASLPEDEPVPRNLSVAPAAAQVADGPDADLRHAAVGAAGEATQGDWRVKLDMAIADLERTLKPQPATISELHDHLRLRALLVAAGREEEAYRPIPGASPAQQDYWSKQLFAMATYLNNAATVDDKQRAAAALVHLEEARSALGQLATLQIRNQSFVKSVDGFGAYEPLKHAEFQPGDSVTVYAEVDNFGSASTPAGYETSLGTSYQVLDATGRRVEGGQFPDVTDLCHSRRRDFHLQYGVGLPTGIYPGEYRLELTITDHRTGKIGQAVLPLEIVGQR